MTRSLITDPMSWWPLGIVIGGVIGAVANRYEKHRATADRSDPPDVAASATMIADSPTSIPARRAAEM